MVKRLYVQLSTQMRIVFALLMREVITRYGRHNIGFMWMFVEPMMFTLGIVGLWSFTRTGHSEMPIIPFAVTGYSSVLLWRNMPSRTSGAVQPNLSLLYHRNVTILDVFLARVVLEAAGATMSFFALSIVFMFLGFMGPPEDLLKVVFAWGLLAWFGFGLATSIGALSELSEVIEKIWHPMTYLVFPLSGAVFMVDWLPPKAQDAISYIPMVHGVELLREGFFGSKIVAHYDLYYFITINLVLSCLGLFVTRVVSQRVIPE